MPKFETRDELGWGTSEFADPSQWNESADKASNLQQRKQEKLNTLGTKVGAADNQILNNLSDSEYQYLVGRSARDLAQPKTAYGEDNSNRWLYSYGSDDGKIKLGTATGAVSDPDARYDPEMGRQELGNDYGWKAGPEGVNTRIPDNRMKLLFPEQVANTLEHLGHGREEALDARSLVKPENSDDRFWQEKETLGSGYTEYYDSKEGFYGDSRDDADFDKEELWDKFLVSTGQKEPEALDTSSESQPIATGSDDPFERLQQTALQRESSGNYKAINDQGYVGGYQFGAQALEDLGYLKEGASSRGNKVVGVEQAWTGKDGINSLQDFLSNPKAQDKAFEENLDANYQRLLDSGVLDENAPKEEIGGRLLAAHLLGAQGSSNLEDTDAYGTSGLEYYELGKKAVSQEAEEVAEEPSIGVMSDRELYEWRQNRKSRGEKFIDEIGQTIVGVPAGIVKGAVDLIDAGQEFATWPVQSAVRAVTGDKDYDIDLVSDEFKKSLVGGVDTLVGYDRAADEVEFQNAIDEFEKAGIDITSMDSIVEGVSNPDKNQYLSEGTKLMAANPSFLFSMISEFIGAGGVAGAATKGIAKGAAKVAPKLASKASKYAKSNTAKINEQVDAVRASKLPAAEKAARINELEKSYTLGKRLPDIIKGNTYSNADLAIRMNEDIEAFEANNEGEEMSPEKMLQTLIINRIASAAETGALKFEAKIGKIGKEAAEQSFKRAAVASGAHILKSSGAEAVQETFDGIVQQINQKLNSSDYQDKSLNDILEEESAEIIGGTVMGATGGGYMGAATETTKGLRVGSQELTERLQERRATQEAQPTEETDQETFSEEYITAVDNLATVAMEESGIVNETNFKNVVDSLESLEINKIYEDSLTEQQRNNSRRLKESFANKVKRFIDENPERDISNINSEVEAERVINLVLGSGPIDETSISNLNKFAKKNKVSQERFDALVKNYESVREEATVGNRGYHTVELRMRSNIDSGTVDKKKLNKDYQQLVRFRNSTDESIRNLERGIEEAKNRADRLTRSKAPTSKKVQRIKTDYRKDDRTRYNIDVVKRSDNTWEAKVDDALERLNEKKTTRSEINKILNEVSAKASDELDVALATEDFIVPTNTVRKEGESARKSDNTYISNLQKTIRRDTGKGGKVNKVILDENASPKWKANSDYRKLNSPLINTGEYSSEDTVLLNAMGVRKGKGKYSKYSGLMSAESNAGKEIREAIQAGSTIALDREYNTSGYETAKEVVTNFLKSEGYEKVAGENYFVPKNEATEDMLKSKQEEVAKKEEERNKLRGEKSTASRFMASYKVTESREDKDKLEKKLEEIAELEGKEKKEVRKQVTRNFNKNLEEAIVELEAVEKGLSTLSELEKFGNDILKLAEAKVEERKSRDLSSGLILSMWKEATEVDRLSGTALNKKIKELVDGISKPMEYGKSILKEKALGKGMESVWEKVYLVEKWNGKTNSYESAGTREVRLQKKPNSKEVKTFSEGKAQRKQDGTRLIPVAIREVNRDVSNLVKVKRPTIINTLGVENLTEGLKERADKFVDFLEKSIAPTKEGTVKDTYNVYNSPARALVYDKDGNIIPEVALAMDLSLGELFETDMFKLTTGNKTNEDIARMFKVDVSDVTKEMREFAKDKGMLRKTMADTLGKGVMTRLGFGIDKEAELGVSEYASLVADLGNMIILAGQKAGWLNEKKASSNEFARLLSEGDVRSVDTTVSFIDVPTKRDSEGKRVPTNKSLAQNIKDYEIETESLPERKTGEVWPEKKKLSKEAKEKQKSSIRNNVTIAEIPEEGKETLDNLMDTPYVFDTARIDEFLSLVDARGNEIKALLGYIPLYSSEYNKLTYDNKEIQEGINRDIDRSIEVLREFRDSVEEGKTELYFKFFYSTNGRYMMDSNTINPQTDKLHRFLIQPKAHENTFTTEDGLRFKDAEGNDMSFHVREALAQAMGMGIDKVATKKKIRFGNALLSMNKKQREELKETLLAKGEATFFADGEEFEAEAEHLSHMLQAFEFLGQVETGNVTSSITAEYDSLTSGYNNKLQQFPVLENMPEELAKVGIITESYLQSMGADTADTVFNPSKGTAVNDIFANGSKVGFQDSYQSLAKEVLQKLKIIPGELESFNDRQIFEGVKDALPGGTDIGKADIVVKGALRNLFKNPFMIFNYSASIKSIRKNLGNQLATGLLEDIAKMDLKDTESATYISANHLVNRLGIKGIKSVAALQSALRNEPMDKLKVSTTKLVDRIAKVMDNTYGQAVQDTFDTKFEKFIEIQDATNDAFKVMFRLFDAKRVEKLKERAKKGVITEKDQAEVMAELWDVFPYIVGPLTGANNKKEVMTVLDTSTDSPRSVDVSRRSPQTLKEGELTQKGWNQVSKINPMIRSMKEASQAGSVIPFHFIDGAEVGGAFNAFVEYLGGNLDEAGILSIHDAIMAKLGYSDRVGWEYNKKVFKTNKNYSIMQSIQEMLERGRKEVDNLDPTNSLSTRSLTVLREKSKDKKTKKVNFKEAFGMVEAKITNLNTDIAIKRNELYEKTLTGAYFGNMIGSPASLYREGFDFDMSYTSQYEDWYNKPKDIEIVKEESKAKETEQSGAVDLDEPTKNNSEITDDEVDAIMAKAEKARKDTPKKCVEL